MAKVKFGDTVKVHYTGKLADGTIFDRSKENLPLEFKIGEGKIIKGFEQAIIDMEPGEAKTINIPYAEAYGEHKKDLVLEVEKKQFPEDVQLEIGRQLEIRPQQGTPIIVTVTNISDSHVIIDANHPLAGKDLIFDVKLVEIV